MKWKEKMERLNRRVQLAQDMLVPIWVELAKKYPLEQIPMQMRDMPENREWQAAMLDLQNHAIYTTRHNINLEDEISGATEMDGKTVLEFLGTHHGLEENWWNSPTYFIEYSISDTPISGRDGMMQCYNWGFDYVEEAIRVEQNLTDVLSERGNVKKYGKQTTLSAEELREKFGNVRLFLNVKFRVEK